MSASSTEICPDTPLLTPAVPQQFSSAIKNIHKILIAPLSLTCVFFSDQEEASGEESKEKRGVKRVASVSDTDSEDEALSSEETAQPAVPAGKQKGSKKKKKKGRGKFIRVGLSN